VATFVVDASFAAKWLIKEEHSDRADAVLAGGHVLRAPDLIFAELTNVLRTWTRSGVIDRRVAASMVNDLEGLGLDSSPIRPLAPLALDLALEYSISGYDALYLALATTEPCQLLTADRRFHNAVAPRLPATMLWIGDLPAGSSAP